MHLDVIEMLNGLFPKQKLTRYILHMLEYGLSNLYSAAINVLVSFLENI